MKFTAPSAKKKIDKILQALESSDHTAASLKDVIHISRRWANAYLKHMKETNLIHITRYVLEAEGERHYPRPVYRTGEGRNVPRPKPKTNEEKSATRRKKRREDPDYYLHERAGNERRRFKPKPDKAAAWMMTA